MGIPHQDQNCKCIMFLAFFIFCFVFSAKTVQAYNSLFIVENVSVDVTAENSVAAQEQAFEVAQVKAFKVLAQRLVDEAQANTMETPDSLTISSLVKDYEITNEQLSSVRYVGTYTFRFREKEVSSFFSLSGVSFTEAQSKTLLVLPVFQKDGKNSIWSQDNIWMKAWSGAELSRGLVPVEVPIGDLMDIADIDDNNALSYNRVNLDRMLERYDAGEAAVMIAVPDMDLLAVEGDDEQAKGRLRISIYRTDYAQAEYVKDLNLQADGEETRDDIYNRAVQMAYAALQKDWKRKTISSIAETQTYQVHASFNTLKQWTSIQNALRRVSGISNVSVLSVKKNEAFISFTFRGDEVRLSKALREVSLNLGSGYANSAAHDFTESGRNAPELIYDITLGYNDSPDRFYNGVDPQAVEPAAGSENSAQNSVHTF